MNKIILVQHAAGLYAAFDDNNVHRACPGDLVIISGQIKLTRDLVLDVPVTMVMYGAASEILCGRYCVRYQLKPDVKNKGQKVKIISMPSNQY